ncbi:hypothetical protein LTR47_010382 [Exophiala xenobiotica]|nr:hypothetical protein LTR47_010382 [Exophiala xenobiotica]KAK5252579.1 hypothetical protein LTS06_002986 [Exophiala xenobiotica]KAK5279487.1 hypothetical protein LTR40_007722 [Exophiala xenobiotica]KAK5347478.1 hypothetical protein LTR61_008749 [Exophiala xenobiotica]KAK5359862.1 hypothetical protein LTS03_010869 [Exophiala xenobiotica]
MLMLMLKLNIGSMGKSAEATRATITTTIYLTLRAHCPSLLPVLLVLSLLVLTATGLILPMIDWMHNLPPTLVRPLELLDRLSFTAQCRPGLLPAALDVTLVLGWGA